MHLTSEHAESLARPIPNVPSAEDPLKNQRRAIFRLDVAELAALRAAPRSETAGRIADGLAMREYRRATSLSAELAVFTASGICINRCWEKLNSELLEVLVSRQAGPRRFGSRTLFSCVESDRPAGVGDWSMA